MEKIIQISTVAENWSNMDGISSTVYLFALTDAGRILRQQQSTNSHQEVWQEIAPPFEIR